MSRVQGFEPNTDNRLPAIEAATTIEMFFESIKDKYPNITLEHLKIICRSPFKMLRESIKSGIFPRVRLKGFGVFSVDIVLANYGLDRVYQMFKENRITEEDFILHRDMLLKYIDKNKEDERYQIYIRKSKKHPKSIVHQYLTVKIDNPIYDI